MKELKSGLCLWGIQWIKSSRFLGSLLYVLVLGYGCTSSRMSEDQYQESLETEIEDTSPLLSTQTQAIQGGSTDDEQTNVVGLVIQQGYSGGGCTGSLIAPNLVLTAQHCIAPTSSEGILCGVSVFGDSYMPFNIFVTTDTQFPQFGYYRVQEIIVPDNSSSDVCGHDIALLILNQNVPTSEAVPLIPRLDEPVVVGERFKATGYGHVGDGSGAGVRRSIYRREVLCLGYLNGCGEQNQSVYQNEWVGNDGTCEGDSGGPALDDQGQVLGVLSRGGQGCSFPVYTDIVEVAPWIREVADRAASFGNYTPPSWVSGTAGTPPPDDDGDGIPNRYDNCEEISNPSQEDFDQDRIGDLCDPLVSTDRGGVCEICDSCTTDADCGTDGGQCLLLQTGGVCSYSCRGDFDCPSTSTCLTVTLEERYCLNEDIETAGLCPSSYICGGSRGITQPVDDGLCHVCEPCNSALECASGICANIAGKSVCSRACEVDTDCRPGSACLDQNGRKLCVNANAGDVGICPDDFECSMEMQQEDEIGGMMSEEMDGDPIDNEDDPNSVEKDTEESDSMVANDEGCQSTSNPPHFSLLFLLALLYLKSIRGRETGLFPN